MIDTNVLARYSDQQSTQHPDAKGALRRLQAAGHDLVINPQIKREFLDIAERPQGAGPGKNGLGLSNQQARRLVEEFRAVFSYVEESPAVDEQFDQLHQKYGGGKTVHDLNIVASMLAHGIPLLLTFNDRHFNHLQAEGIKVHTPQQVLTGAEFDPAT
ncbi:type II toxin-antitoxin system VapC family toxin [Planctomicrobium sp. SH668]|uniref:type II toxin-antitoxin system VapC family toxin n=1 Tax=Planctomicrobium sp. SH668 TaxID=3448126 RepID=UPI003F5B726E